MGHCCVGGWWACFRYLHVHYKIAPVYSCVLIKQGNAWHFKSMNRWHNRIKPLFSYQFCSCFWWSVTCLSTWHGFYGPLITGCRSSISWAFECISYWRKFVQSRGILIIKADWPDHDAGYEPTWKPYFLLGLRRFGVDSREDLLHPSTFSATLLYLLVFDVPSALDNAFISCTISSTHPAPSRRESPVGGFGQTLRQFEARVRVIS